MLIWLNGAHGAGKTSTAKAILARRPDARLIDPEQIGFLLRRTWPGPLPDDFKDMPVWREMTLALLRSAARGEANPLVVPMTLADTGHFREIVGGLRAGDVPVRHFTLTVSIPTLKRRLGRRLDWPRSRRWALAQAERTAAALRDDLFAEHIAADTLSVAEIAETVLGRAGV